MSWAPPPMWPPAATPRKTTRRTTTRSPISRAVLSRLSLASLAVGAEAPAQFDAEHPGRPVDRGRRARQMQQRVGALRVGLIGHVVDEDQQVERLAQGG